jgi:(p)ppGpp synthase/HD superfamily hydrolase
MDLRFLRVANKAVELHSSWPRKSAFREDAGEKRGLPYFFHPVAVVQRLWNWGVRDEVTLVAAIGHDLLEDTLVTVDQLRSMFESSVDVIQELTFIPDPSWDDKTRAEKKAEWISSFASRPVNALVVKIADRLENVLDFGRSKPDYAGKYFHKADCLFSAFYKRIPEISEAYGIEVVRAMAKSIRKFRDWIDRKEAMPSN